MIVAIHQPNYAPWLGYFSKIAQADSFVFLDDAQYTKNSYINRAQFDVGGTAKWLTVPVSYAFGDPILAVRPARADWTSAHIDSLRSWYRGASAYAEVMPWVEATYAALPAQSLAGANVALIQAIAGGLGLSCRFHRASEFGLAELSGDARLAALVSAVGVGAVYLSGSGGAKYQAAETFAAKGIGLPYSCVTRRPYDQGHPNFLPGLSVVDALFRLGWRAAAAMLAPERARA